MQNKQSIRVFNSISGEKEIFKPIVEGYLGLYVCGPTVYNYVHLGNLRTFLSFDLILRYFKLLGYKVKYVRNITDVGHLLEDSEEDKISERARLEKLEPLEIVKKYTDDFHSVCHQFNLISPNIEPTATGHLVEQIAYIQSLIEKGYAYISNKSVYFDVKKYSETNDYGELSKRNIEDLISNSRELEGQSDKKSSVDFALWKNAMPNHIMRWASPWGIGFPGWHLECTVMSTKYLGETFDIHGGGMDLKFPHHECEIAQGTAHNHKKPANYWIHTNMLTLNGQKMSKSTGNSILPTEIFSGENDFFDDKIEPMVLRFFMLQAHYRSTLDLSNDAIKASGKAYAKLMQFYLNVMNANAFASKSTLEVNKWLDACYNAMNDDFNSPMLIAKIFDAIKAVDFLPNGELSLTKEDAKLFQDALQSFITDLLGFLSETKNFIHSESDGKLVSGLLNLLSEVRAEARASKNYILSDKIRDELANLNVEIKDTKKAST